MVLPDQGLFSLVLLGRGGRTFLNDTLTDLSRSEAAELLVMETGDQVPDPESLSVRYPGARFYHVRDAQSPGALVNLAAREVSSTHFLVLWSDTALTPPVVSHRMLLALYEKQALCLVPRITDSRGESEPVCISPVPGEGGTLETWFSEPEEHDRDTLFPYDYIGFYNRDDFIRCGGYDTRFLSPYWQKMDFGFRCRMMGFRIRQTNALKLVHSGQYPLPENTTCDADYPFFVLKNLIPRFRQDRVILPGIRFLGWWRSSGLPFREAWSEYKRTRKFLYDNRGLYRTDSPMILETWGSLS